MKKKNSKIMKYQIDQSGKIENTEKPTVIAASNHITRVIVIPARIKRQFQEACRREGLTRLYVYILFAVGVHTLIVELKTQSKIIIDTEYPGKEKLIIDLIKIFMGKRKANIDFARIGNKPKVHYAAHDVYAKKKKADKVVSLQDILQATKKTDGRLRECLSTLVGAQSRPLKAYYHPKNKKSNKP